MNTKLSRKLGMAMILRCFERQQEPAGFVNVGSTGLANIAERAPGIVNAFVPEERVA